LNLLLPRRWASDRLQRLSQSDGYETLLIQTEGLRGSGYEADDEEVEDLVDRFDRWGTRS